MAEAELAEADEDEDEWQRQLRAQEQRDVDCPCGVGYDDGRGAPSAMAGCLGMRLEEGRGAQAGRRAVGRAIRSACFA